MKKFRYQDEEDYYNGEDEEHQPRRFRQHKETADERKKRWDRESLYDQDNDYDERR